MLNISDAMKQAGYDAVEAPDHNGPDAVERNDSDDVWLEQLTASDSGTPAITRFSAARPAAPPIGFTQSVSGWRASRNPSPINQRLEALDKRLNPDLSLDVTRTGAPPVPSLLRFRHGQPVEQLDDWTVHGPAVVLVHGIFSRGASLAPELLSLNPPSLYCIDYPSTSAPPLANATLIAAKLRIDSTSGPVLFVAHSQGGLVLRWLLHLRADLRSSTRSIYLGVPHQGSSIVSAEDINSTLNHFATYASTVAAMSSLAVSLAPGIFGAAAAIFGIGATALKGLAGANLADALIHCCPAIASMQAGRNNFESNVYSAVAEAPRACDLYVVGAWSSSKLSILGATSLLTETLFGTEPNDGVVNTSHMRPLGVCQTLSVNAHHCGYLANDDVRQTIATLAPSSNAPV